MPVTAEELFLAALSLPPKARAELTDRLVTISAETIDPELERAHLDEVRRRIAQVEAGEVELIDGTQVLAEARALLNRLGGEHRDRLG